MDASSLQKASDTKVIHNGHCYQHNCRHLQKDCGNTSMCQQEVDWEESDSDEGEEEEETSTEQTSTTDSRLQLIDEPVMTPSTRQQNHPHCTSTFGRIIKPPDDILSKQVCNDS